MNVDHALDLLEPGESAVVLFTKRLFQVVMRADGSGSSGNWVMNPEYHSQPDKVIIYNRLPDRVPRQSVVYVADYADAVQSEEPGRLVVRFSGAKQVGTTKRSWYDFAERGPRPVRYLSKR